MFYFYLIMTVFIIGTLPLSGCCLKQSNGPSLKTVEGIPPPAVKEASAPLIRSDADLRKVVLAPRDLAGLFPPSYSIIQNIDQAGVKGVLVTYQTESIPHTLAFAKGYSTRIEIYKDAGSARSSFKEELGKASGTQIPMGKLGEESLATRGEISTPEGFVVAGEKFSLVFRYGNAMVSLQIRTHQSLTPQRLEALGTLILDRLKAIAP